jgi:hypothetical protein
MKKKFAAVFLTFHVVALTLANYPGARTEIGEWIHRWVDFYVHPLALQQKWNMFRTHTKLLRLKVEVEATGENGETRRFGPLLPDLEFFPESLSLRTLTFFHRLERWRKTPKYSRYVQKLCRAIAARGFAPASLTLIYDQEVFLPAERGRRNYRREFQREEKEVVLCQKF